MSPISTILALRWLIPGTSIDGHQGKQNDSATTPWHRSVGPSEFVRGPAFARQSKGWRDVTQHRDPVHGDDEQPSPPPPPPLAVGERPAPNPLPTHLEDLADRARGYAEAASSANTRRAYASDWSQFQAWCRRQCLAALPPNPQIVGLYIAALASGTTTPSRKPSSVSTIERR